MKGKIIALFFMIFIMHSSCYALKLSQPIGIGELASKDGFRYISQFALSTSLENQYYDFGRDNIVRFYLMRNAQNRFGDPNNINNTVPIWSLAFYDVFEVISDKGYVFFVINDGGTDGGQNIDVIGKNPNGKYISYINRESFANFCPEKNWGPLGQRVRIVIEGDTIILNCSDKKSSWQYRLKWDDHIRRFGIEYIVASRL